MRNHTLEILAAVMIGLFLGGTLSGGETTAAKKKPLQSELAPLELARSLGQIHLDTGPFQKEMSYAQFLELLNEHMTKKKMTPLRVDDKAWGDKLNKLRTTPFPAAYKTGPASMILRLTMSGRKSGDKLYLRPAGTHLLVTTAEHASFTMTHDVRDLLPHVKLIRQFVYPDGKDVIRPPVGGAADSWNTNLDFLVRALLANVAPESWQPGYVPGSTMKIHNGSQLVVQAALDHHEELANFLNACRRVLDVAVVFPAQLYEVDQAFFQKQIEPALKWARAKTGQASVFPISAKLEEHLGKLKPILESGIDERLPLSRWSSFLSWHVPFPFQVFGPEGKTSDRLTLAGFSLDAWPTVSPDRRFIHLKITLATSQPFPAPKMKILDPEFGEEVFAARPNLRQESLTHRIEIPDGQTLLIPVVFRPVELAPTKTWVVLVRPRIWIEEEERMIRAGQIPPIPGPARIDQK